MAESVQTDVERCKPSMKQQFLKKESSSSLLLIFGGWGTWPGLFSSNMFPQGYDVMLCYDYHSLDFDASQTDGYDNVRLIAWSMGVWAASVVFGGNRLKEGQVWEECIAVNGTMYPRDNEKGIPESVFDGTLDNMSSPVIVKFRRRMCGKSYQQFLSLLSDSERTVEDLKEELSSLRNAVILKGASVAENCFRDNTDRRQFFWSRAIAGKDDLIFPFSAQKTAWNEAGVQVEERECAHYDADLFHELISGL